MFTKYGYDSVNMKVVMKQMLVAKITFYVLIHNANGANDCEDWLPRSQCACISNCAEFTSSYNSENIIYMDKEEQQNGLINVQLPIHYNTTKYYNSSNYEILLRVKENVTSDVCRNNLSDWKIHSEIKSYNVYNMQQCPFTNYGSKCKSYNNNNPGVTFDYIFSGCYILVIFEHIESEYESKATVYESKATFISTNYTKKRLVDKNVINTTWPLSRGNQEFEIAIQINSTYIFKPPSIKTTLTSDPCEQNCVILSAITQVNYKNNSFTEYSETFTQCDEFLNITWNCAYSEEAKELDSITWYICKYTGLTSGNYGYVYELLDEYTRCNFNSIWAYPGDTCRLWARNIVVPEHKPDNMTNFDVTTEDLHYEYIIIPIVIILLLCSLTILHKLKRNRSVFELHPQDTILEELPMLNTQEILIIYARDSKLFTAMMESFKQLLSSIDENITVHDINVHNEAMCADPENWIRNKILNEHTKFILFLNKCGLTIFENQVISGQRSKIVYKNAKWQDDMFPCAIKLLPNTTAINYTNLFVITTIYCNTSEFDHINPGTRFLMPNSIEILLNHIFPNAEHFSESFLKDFNDCCCKYNAFCEENLDYVNDILQIQ